jgi:hypothetical protein
MTYLMIVTGFLFSHPVPARPIHVSFYSLRINYAYRTICLNPGTIAVGPKYLK